MKKHITQAVAVILAAFMLLGLMSGCASKNFEDTVSSIYSDVSSVANDARGIDTTVTLKGMKFADTVSAEQVKLGGAFAEMTLRTVERKSDTEVRVAADGACAADENSGFIAFAAEAVIEEKAPEQENLTDEEKAAKAELEAAEKDAFPYSVSIRVAQPKAEVIIENTDNKNAAVTVNLTDDTFKNNISPEHFTVAVGEKTLSVASAERKDDANCLLTFAENANEAFASLEDGSLKISADALACNKELSCAFGIYDAALSAKADFVEEQGDGFVVTTVIRVANGTFADIDASSVTVGGDLGETLSFEKTSASELTLKNTVKKDGATLENIEIEATVSIKGIYAKTLWGAEKSDAEISLDYHATEEKKELLAVETSLVFDLIKTGILALATEAGSVGAKRIFSFIDEDSFEDETAKELSKLNEYLRSMDAKWTAALGELNLQLSIMSDKLGKNDCSRALDDFDTLADRIRSLVLHLKNKKKAVDSAKKGTPEYEKAAAEYVKAVEKESSKIYTEAHLLGSKILSGSAGLTSGIIGTYDEMLSYIYNFDVQTYDLKENFRVFVLSLYLEAYDEAVLYYELTDPENQLLRDLKSQMTKLNAAMKNIEVVRRADKDDYVYCYALGKEVKRFVEAMFSNEDYTLDEAKALNMAKRAESRGTTLRADLEKSGFYSVSRRKNRNGIEYDKLCFKIEKHKNYSKTTREWWTLTSRINIDTHEVEKNVKTYYQKQERSGFNAFFGIDRWSQTECWGTYNVVGFVIRGK